MENYIVCYDLSKPHRDYGKIINAIEDVYLNTRLTESCWILRTASDRKTIFNHLKNCVDSDDKLAIIKLGDDWATRNINTETNNWLQKYVR